MTIGIQVGLRAGITDLTPENFPPIAAFTSLATGLSVAFTDGSADLEGAIASWSWNFGDGNLSSSQSPTHVYAADNTYTVTLTVRDADGATAQVSHNVTVTAATWITDAAAGIATAADATEWTSFLAANPSVVVGVPDYLWLFQEASGNLAGAIGAKTLTVTGAPLYQQTEAGWTRKFIAASGGLQNQFAANGTMNNTATTSVMLLAFARIVQPVAGHQRMFWGGASNNAFEGIALSPNIRLRTGGNAGNGATDHTGTVRPYVVIHDVTNSLNIIYSNVEKKKVTYGAAVGSAVQFQFGLLTDATVNTLFGYAAGWAATKAEFGNEAATDAAVKGLLQAKGWTVSGY